MISNYKRTEENKKSKNSGIYKITNSINNKIYVGQTYDLNYRWNRHKSDLNNNKHSNNHLQSSWNKYGKDNFKYEIIEKCELDVIDDREIYWITHYDSIKNGYNQCEGGLGCRGYKHTEEELMKMRAIQNPKKVIQFDLKGNIIKEWESASQASKQLNLYSLAIKKGCERKNYVKTVGSYIWMYKDEYEQEGLNNYYLSQTKLNTKKINQYDMNMNFIKTWESVKSIADELGYSQASIRNNCTSKTKFSHGCIWRYYN